MSTEDLDVPVNKTYDHTIQLARDNDIELADK